MESGTTYYWHVDEVNAVGTMPGDVWSFSTEALSGDIVTITEAEYQDRNSRLTVVATSDQSGAVMTVQNYGEMTYHSGSNTYRYREGPVTDPGRTITVISNLGGSTTADVTHR